MCGRRRAGAPSLQTTAVRRRTAATSGRLRGRNCGLRPRLPSRADGPPPPQGRGEPRDRPTTGARVVTDPQGLSLSETDHRPLAS
jgi:hypothetical protein